MWYLLLATVFNLVLAEDAFLKAKNVALDVEDRRDTSNNYVENNTSGIDIDTPPDSTCTSVIFPPENGSINCQRSASDCTVSCKAGYKFPHLQRELEIKCQNNEWVIPKTNYSAVPSCEPTCWPQCKNNGTCVAPYKCHCIDNFWGFYCQYENKTCTNEPSKVANSKQICSSSTCSVICQDGFTFPDSTKTANLQCKNGDWVPTKSDWIHIPDCQPLCEPPCENEGVCLSSNACECPKSFLGSRCQYHENICSSDKLVFNGSTDCQLIKNETYTCKLGCPAGTNFEFPPAESYVCQFLTGSFEPQPVPRCLPVTSIETKIVEKTKPKGGSCFTWAGVHFKTFDGRIYSFESNCSYTLLKETKDNLFSVSIQNVCSNRSSSTCSRLIRIFLQDEEYILSQSDDQPVFRRNSKIIQLPTQLPSVTVMKDSKFIQTSLEIVGLKLKWDGSNLVQLSASELLWNRTNGLCGILGGDNDLESRDPVNEWKLEDFGEKCKENSIMKLKSDSELTQEAETFCQSLLGDASYRDCKDARDFLSACHWDYYNCKYGDRRKCTCQTLSMFVRQCALDGIVSLLDWKDQNICSMECSASKIYMLCGPVSQTTCNGEELRLSESCEEGCYCQEGWVLSNGQCIEPKNCPCQLGGESFEPGSTVTRDCNTCTCEEGRWICTESSCDASCSVISDYHYTTFDGKKFDFLGQCNYYLAMGNDYSVEIENSSSISSESFGYIKSRGGHSYMKTIKVRANDTTIELIQDQAIRMNGEDVKKLPMMVGDIRVHSLSSIFMSIELRNGMKLLWDGTSSVYVNAPASLKGKTKGLCGTFTSNQKDDFLTPEGDVEQSILDFANKWKTNENCENVKSIKNHPCDMNPIKRAGAKRYCSVLKEKLFSTCHLHVDPNPFFKDCMYDMCECEGKIDSCLCSTLAAYAKECAQLGVIVSWRLSVPECRIDCPGDQEYQVCENSCTRSCTDISSNHDCKEQCIEGCNCPKGQTLNDNNECIPIDQCPCTNGVHEVRQGIGGLELCTCAGGIWNCHHGSVNETSDYPVVTELKDQCGEEFHLEMSTCKVVDPRTCHNMHQNVNSSSATCQPGCVCKSGYVLDALNGSCVLERDCPCYHGGRSYQEGATTRADCNTCLCTGGQWICTKNACPGVCSVWGDSHYTTFDDHPYDFQGACDYLLAKASLNDVESFDVSVQNVVCGTTGVTCSKSVTLSVGKRSAQESITLTRGKTLNPDTFVDLERIVIRRSGLFVFLDVPDLGVVVQWDEGTRVYVRVDPRWKNRTQGLCGDFNDNAEDDFKTPSGGLAEASTRIFGDSWKMSEFCAEPEKEPPNTCTKHPERELWAVQRCRIMESEIFEPCHSEVAPDDFINKCIYDACGCDSGGDCECLCTAIAAYAHKCNSRGIFIQWRTQKLCPMQCDKNSFSYAACTSTCPLETCENLATHHSTLHLCKEDTCIEGCEPKACPESQIYLNSSYSECVPRIECRPICKVINGVTYTEGEKIKSDKCHTCFCSRGKVVCQGEPYPNDDYKSIIPIANNNCDAEATSQIYRDCSLNMTFNEEHGQCEPSENIIEIGLTSSQNNSTYEISGVAQTEYRFRDNPEKCRSGEYWSPCAVRCTKTCEYFEHYLTKSGVCNKTIDCVAGCVPKNQAECTSGLWKSKSVCVERSQCTCKSNEGLPISPGIIVNETECRICQCINNFYTCDESACEEDIKDNIELLSSSSETEKDPENTIIVPNTSTPPRACGKNSHYTWLIENDPSQVKFNASSFTSPLASPFSIQLRRTGIFPAWFPNTDNTWQWVEVRLEKPRPIYGLIVGGDVISNNVVTSYRVLFSEDGELFSYFKLKGKPKLFSGPVYSAQKVRVMFRQPIDAKVVRVNPVTWHKGIAMQFELVGCEDTKEDRNSELDMLGLNFYTDVDIVPVCADEMGYNNNTLSDQQVSVSSSFKNAQPNLRLSSRKVWRPFLDNMDQYVQFDFLESRNITGIETKGGNGTWTTAYRVRYSNDGQNWNPLFDENRQEVEFLGNVDDRNSKINYFKKPIGARFLKILPTRWKRHIGLKVEVLGCFNPYPSTDLKPPTSQTNCNICNGITVQNVTTCNCKEPLWWNGQNCVSKHDCHCSSGGWAYPVGSSYHTHECEDCLCSLGGIPVCQRKACPSCESGFRPVLTDLCACLCLPCPVGQRLCPTSNDCVDESKWCNGVQDCPDDEVQCPTPSIEDTTVHHSIKIKCQSDCPSGFDKLSVNLSSSSGTEFITEIQKSEFMSNTLNISRLQLPEGQVDEERGCPKFTCKPKTSEKCSPIECPAEFQLRTDRRKRVCDGICVPIPPPQKICSLSGRTFETFDGSKYKFDACNHIMVLSRKDDWFIMAKKTCENSSLTCYQSITVKIDDHEIVLQPDMLTSMDEIFYLPDEMIHLGDKSTYLKLARVGNAVRLESRKYPFWVLLDSSGNVKVGLSVELSGEVDGLCGFMDGLPDNDQRTPGGKVPRSTQEFGESWNIFDSSDCVLQSWPQEIQLEAWKVCSVIQDSSFSACGKSLDRDRYLSSCLESTRSCLTQENATSASCRCQALEFFVRECLTADPGVDLSAWRTIHDCMAACEAPFVHKDCFRNKCEMSCENLNEPDTCPPHDGLCVSGCFCPDGMVRSGDTCVPASHCRDCFCDILGDSKYISFDGAVFTLNGDCSRLISRASHQNNSNYTYEVLISNGRCGEHVCTEVITVLFDSHFAQIRRGGVDNKLISIVDEKQVESYPHNSWVNLYQSPGSDIKLEVPSLKMEIDISEHNFAAVLRMPSQTFGGKMQGICGNCDGDPSNDLRLHSGELTDKVKKFGESWRLKRTHASLRLKDKECESFSSSRSCNSSDVEKCRPLLEYSVFARCHNLVDPVPYYKACQNSLCRNNYECYDFEAYARACSMAGICIDWRTDALCPMNCSQNLEYRACKSACPMTCDNLKPKDHKCARGMIEGCFCPEGKIWHKGSCIPEHHCYSCDDEGHMDGDFWQTSKCTNCTCQGQQLRCHTSSCPALETVCEQNSRPILVPETAHNCCPKYYCVPYTKNSNECSDNQQPLCGFTQTLKITYDSNNCTKFICECVPEEECSKLLNEFDAEVEELEPGFVRITDLSGCCPRIKKVCQPETCPRQPECPKYFRTILTKLPSECCSKHDCVPPRDLCIVTKNSHTTAMKIGESWQDGVCKNCTCELANEVPVSSCSIKKCLQIEDHPDREDYVLKLLHSDKECCPKFERIGCKFGNQTFKVRQKWQPNPNDPCVTVECANDTMVHKKTFVSECQESCELGSEYQPSLNKSLSCCGRCTPTRCVLADGSLKKPGDVWLSSNSCATSTCTLVNESLQVQIIETTCEPTDLTEELNYKLSRRRIPDQCCPEIVRTACLSNGSFYEPGQIWSVDVCTFESCTKNENGVLEKHKEIQTCNARCSIGWTYEQPNPDVCCGTCKQTHCVVEGTLYEPGETWYSADNCTTYSCTQKSDQFIVSTSYQICPDVNCLPEFTYKDGCCTKCIIENENMKKEMACAAEVFDFEKTIGLLVEKKGNHGICKNLEPIKGLTECEGQCTSSTHFNNVTWNQDALCKCCQPVDFRKIQVELTCEDGKRFKKKITVPAICSCESCPSDPENHFNTKKVDSSLETADGLIERLKQIK